MNRNNDYRWSRLLLLLLVLTVMFCLTGCMDSKVDLSTRIYIDADQSGRREMTMSLRADDFNSILGFSDEELEKVLKASCPKGLSWESKTDDKDYSCTFTLSFKNLQDYTAKVQKIIGKKAHAKLVTSSRIFSSGLAYEEDFTSAELFQWMITALQKKSYLTSENAGIFRSSDPEIYYKDQVYQSREERAVYNNLLRKSAARIDVCTVYHENNLCDRDLIFFFDEQTMSDMGQLIKERLAARCPKNAMIAWDIEDGITSCTFRQKGMTVQELNHFMQCILKHSESFVHAEGLQRPSTFLAVRDWNETLDVSLLTSGVQKNFILGYYVKWDKDVDLAIHNQNEGDALALKASKRYKGYRKVFEDHNFSRSLKTRFQTTYAIKKIAVKDEYNLKNKLKRSIRFFFSSRIEQEDLEAIVEGLKDSRLEGVELGLAEDEKGYPILEIMMNQGIRLANQNFETLFQVQGQTSHEVEKKLLAFKHPGVYKICMDFTRFISNKPSQTTLDYEVHLPRLETIKAETVRSENNGRKQTETIEEHVYHVSKKGAFLDLVLESETLNVDGLYVGLILLCLILLVLTIRLFPPIASRLFKKSKKVPKALKDDYEEEEMAEFEWKYEKEQRRYERDQKLRELWRDQEGQHAQPANESSSVSDGEICMLQEKEVRLPEE